MKTDFIRIWTRRVLSTIVMMSVFFAAFASGLHIFINGDVLRGGGALVYAAFGLVISRLLWT